MVAMKAATDNAGKVGVSGHIEVSTGTTTEGNSGYFHLDTGIGVGCLPAWAKTIKKLAYKKLREFI